MELKLQFRVTREKIGRDLMDQITHCPKCGKRLVPVVTLSGRTDLQCIICDDPAVKSAESPLIAPEKPNVAEPGLANSAGTRSDAARRLQKRSPPHSFPRLSDTEGP
jgi:hypothetical protein